MRPLPARVLFSLLALGALLIGVLTRQVIFFAVAAMAAVFLGSSLSTSWVPLTRQLRQFEGHAVDVRLWGAPPESDGSAFVLESVNLISVGVHVFFNASSGRLMHLKVAQPRGPVLSQDRVVIATARYVQWNGSKVKPSTGADAASIAIARPTEREPEMNDRG